MVTYGFPVSGIGVTVAIYGRMDIGSRHAQVLYMRTLNGIRVLTVGYCDLVDGMKTTDDTMNIMTATTGIVTDVAIARTSGMMMEDMKIVES